MDVPNHFYSYSFEPNPDWSNYFSRRDELKAYIDACASKHGIVKRRIALDETAFRRQVGAQAQLEIFGDLT